MKAFIQLKFVSETHWAIKLPLILLFFIAGPGLFNACTTKKNTFTSRTYHNLTSHYNAFWNGRESFREGVADLEKNAKDNYTTVLPVVKYGTKQDAQSINPKMDRAIEKASKVIQKHSMYFGRKEYVRWIDDSYMLIGKAYLYKKDYQGAKRTFNFIINRFAKDNSRYEAELWLAKVYIQNKEFEKAETQLDNFKSNLVKGKAPSYLEKDFNMTFADYYIARQRYEKAIKHLQRSIELTHRKKVKTKLSFILAQIYQELGDTREAGRLYQYVIKKNPPYEMAFNAKINLAKTYDAKSSNRSMIVKKLNKMLKDSKNEEFKDQIYFALAEIYQKDNDLPKTIEYLTLSVATSVSNDFQKSLSSLKLAEIHFESPNYPLAQAYYDTTVQFLPTEFPNYDQIKIKTAILTDLITNITTIEEQDSLQKLAKMPEAERNAIIDKLIKKIAQEEAKKAAEEAERMQSLSMLEQTNRQQNRNIQQSGGWYFYNTSAVSFGFTEFSKKWGRRKLEDLWRLSNKQVFADFGTETETQQAADSVSKDSTAVALVTDPKKREFYTQSLPTTEEKIKESDASIEEAYFNIGYIYKTGLQDNAKSIESFEELLKRFPETGHRLQVYYQLYKNYEEVPDLQKSEYYKNLIVVEFPESDYAKIIIDPNYNLVLEAQQNAAKVLYENTYRAYTSNQYYMVINNYTEAIQKYQESKLLAKFEFLKALAVGKIQNLDSLAVSLEYLVSTYPESEVKPLAQNILSRLKKDDKGNLVLSDKPENGLPGKPKENETLAKSPYSFDKNAVHFFVYFVNSTEININALKIRISDFNAKYFTTDQLKINTIVFRDDTQMITVGNFNNADAVISYYDFIQENAYINSQLEGSNYESMVISVDNYPILYREKDIDVYKTFFAKNYLGK